MAILLVPPLRPEDISPTAASYCSIDLHARTMYLVVRLNTFGASDCPIRVNFQHASRHQIPES
jgi:hypothetical protein